MYKTAFRNKMRIQTPKGSLSVEKVFDLGMSDLRDTLILLDTETKGTSTNLDFLDSADPDSEKQAQFDIVKDIYLTKKRESQEAIDARDKKKRNEHILSLITKKREADLENKSIEELEAMLDK